MTVCLMSVHPWVAAAVLDGKKTAEMRRIVPRLVAGDRVLLYATKPVQRVVASARVERVVRSTPDDLAVEWAEPASLTVDEAREYLGGPKPASRPGVVLLSQPVALEPTPLPFAPPQSYHLLADHDDLASIEPSEDGRKLLWGLEDTDQPLRREPMAAAPKSTAAARIVQVGDAEFDPEDVPDELDPSKVQSRVQRTVIAKHLLYTSHRILLEQMALAESLAMAAGMTEDEVASVVARAELDESREDD